MPGKHAKKPLFVILFISVLLLLLSSAAATEDQSCERIGHFAFADCGNLQAIIFENGNAVFETDFVSGCAALERIIAPEGSAIALWADANGY